MMKRLKSALQPSFGKVVGATVAVCIAGWIGTEVSTDRHKAEVRQRISVRNHNMDVAMGAMWEQIQAAVKASGVCQGRGIYCTRDDEGGWYWQRQSVRGPDVIDITILQMFGKPARRVQVSVFMRDRTGNVAALHAPMAPALNAVIGLLQVSSAGLSECMGAREPRTISDGTLKLVCEKRVPAYYYARDASNVEGSSWNMTVELPG
jgi:hypothetical protein